MSARPAGPAAGWYAPASHQKRAVIHWADRSGLARARCGRTTVFSFRFPALPPGGPGRAPICEACFRALAREAVSSLVREVLGPEALDFMDRADRR